MKPFSAALSAFIIATGLALTGFFIGDGLHHIRANDRYVDVRGLAEREVKSDTAKLTISIEHSGNEPAAIFPSMTQTQKQVLGFLKQAGLKNDEIEIGQWTTVRAAAEDIKKDPTLPRYTVMGSIEIGTHNVDAAEIAYSTINDLRMKTKGGVTQSDVVYSFTGIPAIRAEMVAAATKDARTAALQFAGDSGSQVGSIRNASQGFFEITAAGGRRDDSRAMRKNVRVVTTVSYELKG